MEDKVVKLDGNIVKKEYPVRPVKHRKPKGIDIPEIKADSIEQSNDINYKIGECKKVAESFSYFLNNYVYIEDKENNTAIKLKLWPMQEEIIPIMIEEQKIILLKARQLGLTWLTAAYVLWLGMTKQLNLSLIISVSEDLSIEFLDRVYFILDRLPNYMYPPIKSRTKQVLEFQHQQGLVSIIKSLPTTEMGAQSKTPNVLILDETCKNRMIKGIFNSSYPGIEAAKGKVIVISNSIKEGAGWTWTRDLYLGSMHKVNNFKRIFLPWQANPHRPETFKEDMIADGMAARDVAENYPDTEEQAIEDRNIIGVYYAKQLQEAREQGRICDVPYAEGHEVYTFWDLGVDDSTTIWFMQQIGLQFRFIDYYENTGMSFVHYARILKEKDYLYGDHYMPHDVEQRHLGGGDSEIAKSKRQIAEDLGISPIITVPKPRDTQAILASIENGRNVFGQCVFDAKKCHDGLMGLENYRSKWNEEKGKLGNGPEDNWAIHSADGWRTFCEGYIPKSKVGKKRNYSTGNFSGKFSYLGA